jgi:hypothetical protein
MLGTFVNKPVVPISKKCNIFSATTSEAYSKVEAQYLAVLYVGGDICVA